MRRLMFGIAIVAAIAGDTKTTHAQASLGADRVALEVAGAPSALVVSAKGDGLTSSTDGALELGIGMRPRDPMVEWIRHSFDKLHLRKDGAYRDVRGFTFSSDGKVEAGRLFEDALITEVTFPAMQRGRVVPSQIKVLILAGSVSPTKLTAPPQPGQTPKKWLPSAFQVEIGSLPCERVTKVDELTVKQNVKPDGTGRVRPQGAPRISNLRVTLDARDVAPWTRAKTRGTALDGQITILGPDHARAGTLHLSGLHIVSIEKKTTRRPKTQTGEVTVEIEVGRIRLR